MSASSQMFTCSLGAIEGGRPRLEKQWSQVSQSTIDVVNNASIPACSGHQDLHYPASFITLPRVETAAKTFTRNQSAFAQIMVRPGDDQMLIYKAGPCDR